jgi:hypothetical protein
MIRNKKNIIILATLIAIAIIVVVSIRKPRYLDLPLPSPMSHLPNGDWGPVLYITESYPGEYGRNYILRKEQSVYGNNGNYSFNTPQDVTNYFSDYLSKNGWEIAHKNPFYLCQFGLPEKDYIEEIFLTEYVRPGADPLIADERICVAVIPYTYSFNSLNQTPHFKVLFITLRKYPITVGFG